MSLYDEIFNHGTQKVRVNGVTYEIPVAVLRYTEKHYYPRLRAWREGLSVCTISAGILSLTYDDTYSVAFFRWVQIVDSGQSALAEDMFWARAKTHGLPYLKDRINRIKNMEYILSSNWPNIDEWGCDAAV